MTAPINRKHYKDVEKTVYLTYQLEQAAKKVMFERDMSFSQLVRVALDHYFKTLSQQDQVNSRGNLGTTSGSPNGLFTTDQVAHLLTLVQRGQK